MLFFFRGKNSFAVRAIVGALLVIAGIVVHGGAILIALGAVLLVWGIVGSLFIRRGARRSQIRNGGRMS